MQERQLGYTDLKLTTVGLGTWAMGGPWQFGWGPQDDGDAIAAIIKALEEGINWIDTAPIYGCGHSEELVGKALKQTSQKPFIATKCSLLWNEKREKVSCLKARSIRKECEASLKRLGVDRIDLYQMHWPEPDEDVEEGWEEMARLAEEGKVRYLGASNFNVEHLERVRNIAPVASLQPPYSMLRRDAENELLPYCKENNIGIVVYSPMQRGLLTGKFSKKRSGKTTAQLAIAWVLRRPEVTAAIVGARRPEQIAETAKAGDWNLTEEDIEEIEQLLKERQEKINGKR
jgi:aryl-alcohol dehydrogenase-like predicted oxidoreductase